MLLRLTNVAALNAWRHLTAVDQAMSRSLERLSSGLRINRAGDDPAGFAISERMRTQIRSTQQAIRNAQDGISLLQTAEAGLGETHAMLQRMRELALYAGNGTLTTADRESLQIEMDQLAEEITRLSNAAEFNGEPLLDGGLGSLDLQIGPNAGQSLTASIGPMDAASLGVTREALTAYLEGSSLPAVVALGQIGYGMTSGSWRIAYDGAARSVRLQDNAGNFVGQAVTAVAGSTVKIGDPATGRTMEVRLAATLDANSRTELFRLGSPVAIVRANQPTANLLSTTGVANLRFAAGGLTNGTYSIQYDNAAQTLQLLDGLGAAIGTAVSVDPMQPGQILQVGDVNTDRYLRVQVQSPLPMALVSDTLTITGNPVASLQVLAGSNAVEGAGDGLTTGTYRVAYNAVTDRFQLQTAAGVAIGGWSAADASNTVTVGDPALGRTLTVRVQPVIAMSGWATVEIANDNPAAAPARYVGGMRQSEARSGPGLEIRTADDARAALDRIDKAIEQVSGQRAQLGARVNRLEHTISNLTINVENMTAAESRIRDVDMAAELIQPRQEQAETDEHCGICFTSGLLSAR